MATRSRSTRSSTRQPRGRGSAMLMTAAVVGACLVLGLGSPTWASSLDPDPAAVDAFVTHLMGKHQVPGLAVALIQDGRVSYAAGYGSAGNERPVTPDTPFMLGSITKAFTAAAVLQLVEQDHLDLDTPVQDYLPWFEVADPASSKAITVRHLLNHTSGLSDLGYNHVPSGTATLEKSVRALRSARPTALPGTRHQYFNPGYAVLALLVEVASGEPYGAYVQGHLFEPLGMANSFVDVDDAIAAGMAQGHTKVFGFTFPRTAPHGPSQVGYGHLVASATDVSRFALALAGNGEYAGTRLLEPASVALMRATPAAVPGSTYGMGWSVWTTDGTRVEGHSGAEETFMSNLALLPDHQSGYVWLMNQENSFDPVRAELDAGLMDLLLGRQPDQGSSSMVRIGYVALALFVAGLALVAHSMLRLRGWRDRSRQMSVAGLLLRILPRVVMPLLLLWLTYHGLGQLVTGMPIAFNFRHIGAYYAPEAALLLLLAVVPTLAQAAYMTAMAVVARMTASPAGLLPPKHEGSRPMSDLTP